MVLSLVNVTPPARFRLFLIGDTDSTQLQVLFRVLRFGEALALSLRVEVLRACRRAAVANCRRLWHMLGQSPVLPLQPESTARYHHQSVASPRYRHLA